MVYWDEIVRKCLCKLECVWSGANLNRCICILLLSQRRYWLPVVVTWNFACTATLQMVAPFMISQILLSRSKLRHWPSIQHIYVTHVDGDVHISWLSLLPTFPAELCEERRNNVIKPFCIRNVMTQTDLVTLVINNQPCLHHAVI